MANINIAITFDHPLAVSNTIRFARIDNAVTPVYTTNPGITTSPYVIQDVPNGQYRIGIKPVYADGRVCPEVFVDTRACIGINAFSAVKSAANIVVSYTPAAGLDSVRVNIIYPNGGSFQQIYSAAGTDITITPPSGLTGDFTVTMNPVCDVDSGFIGAATAPAIVTFPAV